ncbi:PD-(D/E)XK nuclease family protein [Puniceicoccaceae bacterium K14]|nr:PD-(D/E)XK nuclease family protein [Puniceicoccaceae bacterium K14]
MSECLIDHWSHSMVQTYQRNPLAFCRSYIARIKDYKSSPSSLIGTGYDEALQAFFVLYSEGREITLEEMVKVGMEAVYNTPANRIKTGSKTPTVESVFQFVAAKLPFVIRSFLEEADTYLSNISEILFVNKFFREVVSLNGVEIPIPCVFVPDLVYRNNEGGVGVLDHKAVYSYTPKDAVIYKYAGQATTYLVGIEKVLGEPVVEFGFFENKTTKNSGGSNKGMAQIQNVPIPLKAENRRLYESMLYEGAREVYNAACDPDKVYLANPNDMFIQGEEKAALLDFWIAWQTQEVEEINPEISPEKSALLAKRKRKIRDSNLSAIDPQVIKKFKAEATRFINYSSMENLNPSERIETRLMTLGLPVKVSHCLNGYSSDTYLLELQNGRRINDIFKFKLDIANALNLEAIRIGQKLTVFEERSYVAVDANRMQSERKPLYWNAKYLEKGRLLVPMGMDNFGNVVQWDLSNPSTPHMLVCGATGSGKSVHIRSIIESVRTLGVFDIEVFDPKYEFMEFDSLNEIQEIEDRIEELVVLMNEAVANRSRLNKLIIFDEFADAVAQSRSGKELDVRDAEGRVIGKKKSLEENLKILLQKGRSSGIRIVAATQRASVKVITGDAKANFPVQVCFRVPKAIDSRVVLDEDGAESLGGKGDGLFRSPDYLDTVRFQSFMVRNETPAHEGH